jgi:hypothetical protein
VQEKAHHYKDLDDAAKALKSFYPNLEIITLYAYFNKTGGISHEIIK